LTPHVQAKILRALNQAAAKNTASGSIQLLSAGCAAGFRGSE
jgi:hypothetical protein